MIVGIDPGLAGALFFLDPAAPATGEAVDLPVHLLARGGRAKREIDAQALVGLLSHPLDHAFVEQAGAMPRQGVSGVFAFGKAYGIILGVLAARAVPVTVVSPARWKRALSVPKAKDGARARASQLMPAMAGEWRLKRQDGRAEACLLALYRLRELNGEEHAMELWVDPRTGEQVQREPLGGCAYGRLVLRESAKPPPGVDLFWTGSNLLGGFDERLNALIGVAWKDLEMTIRRHLPVPHPVKIAQRPDWRWLCRLVPGNYVVAPRRDGGYPLLRSAAAAAGLGCPRHDAKFLNFAIANIAGSLGGS